MAQRQRLRKRLGRAAVIWLLGLGWHQAFSWSSGPAQPNLPDGARTPNEFRERCEQDISDEQERTTVVAEWTYEQRRQQWVDFDSLYGDVDENPEDADGTSLWNLECSSACEAPAKFKQLLLSKPMWQWGQTVREEWSQLPRQSKARTVQEMGLEPLSFMAGRNRSNGYRVKGHAPKPQDPVSLNQPPSQQLVDELQQQIGIFFRTGQEGVSLWMGGSSNRLTDVTSSDWDFYFDVPGVVIDENDRDGLLRHLQEALNCTANLSDRGIAIQLWMGSAQLDLVPRKSTYFDWDHVDFPLFLGSGNRTKVEEDLQLFQNGGAGARTAVRDLKMAFREKLPMLPGFLLEHLVKRVAMMFVLYDPWLGFRAELKIPEVFEVVLCTFEELAAGTQRGPVPFSPMKDFLQNLEAAEPRRRQEMREAVQNMGELAADPRWSNRFLVHFQDLLNADIYGDECFLADPRALPPPHSAYSLFLEHAAGDEKYGRFLELRTSLLQKGGERESADLAELIANVEFFELSMDFWEASQTWWQMSECQRQPWKSMAEEQDQAYKQAAKAKEFQAMNETAPLHDDLVRLQTIREFRRIAHDMWTFEHEPWRVALALVDVGVPAATGLSL